MYSHFRRRASSSFALGWNRDVIQFDVALVASVQRQVGTFSNVTIKLFHPLVAKTHHKFAKQLDHRNSQLEIINVQTYSSP